MRAILLATTLAVGGCQHASTRPVTVIEAPPSPEAPRYTPRVRTDLSDLRRRIEELQRTLYLTRDPGT